MSEWQPIETAPKWPGYEALILFDGKRVFTGWKGDGGQWYCDQFADHLSEIDPPTHWMPLPEPPS